MIEAVNIPLSSKDKKDDHSEVSRGEFHFCTTFTSSIMINGTQKVRNT